MTDRDSNEDVENYDVTVININRNEIQPQFDTAADRNAWQNSKIAKMKWFKTQIFRITSERRTHDNILFIDADVIINKSFSSFEKFVSESYANRKENDCSAYFFQERSYVPDSVNSGTALFFRDTSRILLDLWSKNILTGKYPRDQAALDETLKRRGLQACYFPSDMNYFTTDFMTNLIDAFTLGVRKQGSTFIHPTANKNLRKMAKQVSTKNKGQ